MLKYIKSWSWMRGLRLAAGLFILIQGILTREWWFVIAGGFFTLWPLFNRGCGCSATCEQSSEKQQKKINYSIQSRKDE